MVYRLDVGAMIAALQHGLPIVGTLGINTDRELKEANGHAFILRPPDDEQAFVSATIALIDDADRRALLGRNALELFARRYAWSAIASEMMKILTDHGHVRAIDSLV